MTLNSRRSALNWPPLITIPPSNPAKLYPATGTSDDWAYGELGIASYTFEMGTTFFQDCSSFETTIWPDNLKALLYAFKIAPAPYRLAYGPDALSPMVSPPRGKQGEPLELTAMISDQQNGGRSLQRAEYFILSEHQATPPGTSRDRTASDPDRRPVGQPG